MRLRTVSCDQPGWRRVRCGRGFRYIDSSGEGVSKEHLERIKTLAIPPAWTDVWICPYPRGHLQAVGTDAAGRRQYLYHPQWRHQRDIEKFDRVLAFGAQLPRLRRSLKRDMRAPRGDDTVERVRLLATAIRLLDLGCFRPGSPESADSGSHGLTTLERQHLRIADAALWFRFSGKANIEHEIRIDDEDVARVIRALIKGRAAHAPLLASKMRGRWAGLTADELNGHLRLRVGQDVSAKDFRTWHATTTAAAVLAAQPLPHSKHGRRKRVREAMEAASELLGNTPMVARTSYVDSRVVDLFYNGTVLERVPQSEDGLDRAVARLLHDA